MPGRLDGKTALITGGARGIGRAAVELFAEHGATVAFVDIDAEAGQMVEQAAAAAGHSVAFFHADVSVDRDVSRVVEAVVARFGALQVLYNNASVFRPHADGAVADVLPEVWASIVAVNIGSVHLFSRYVLPHMIAGGGGSIINTASSAAIIGIPYCSAYTATKGATLSLTRAMAVEYGPKRIRVNCIVPAGVETEMMKQSNRDDDSFDRQHFLAKRTPIRRFGAPKEIAYVALFLASDESSYVNGAAIAVDGGISVCGDLSKPGYTGLEDS
jgi:NAD(P)-dependent dehydrogenase (short-subunit alcohol dehydrogenase family)